MLRFVFLAIVSLSASESRAGHFQGDQQDGSDKITRIVLAGDSTVTDNAGWGKGFAELLNDRAECLNFAKSGRSSRSYRNEGWWEKCLEARPDYLLIQFGHNDQPGKGPERESSADSSFRDHLRAFVDEARAAGITPVLITPLTRRNWKPDGTIRPTLAEYAAATTLVAQEKNAALIDLHAMSIQQCEALGATAFRAFEPMSENGADHTHLNSDGSLAVASLVANAISQTVPALSSCFDQNRLKTKVVPQAYQRILNRQTLSLEETPQTVTIRQSNNVILTYNKLAPEVPSGIDKVYARSGFLHPAVSPAGRVVTEAYPFDHAHQSGIFSAWVRTKWHDREIDFWNLAGGTGRVLHQRVLTTFADESSLGFETDLIHRAQQDPVVDILRERWKITAYVTDGSFHMFDLETTQTALTDIPLTIQKYHYGGMAFRGQTRWLTENDSDKRGTAEAKRNTDVMPVREPGSFLNDIGSDRIVGNHEHARWVSFTGHINSQPVTLSVLCHRSNFRAPQAARIHPTKPYFVFSPCVDDEFVIDREHPLYGRYRFLVTDAPADSEWLNEQWESWCQ